MRKLRSCVFFLLAALVSSLAAANTLIPIASHFVFRSGNYAGGGQQSLVELQGPNYGQEFQVLENYVSCGSQEGVLAAGETGTVVLSFCLEGPAAYGFAEGAIGYAFGQIDVTLTYTAPPVTDPSWIYTVTNPPYLENAFWVPAATYSGVITAYAGSCSGMPCGAEAWIADVQGTTSCCGDLNQDTTGTNFEVVFGGYGTAMIDYDNPSVASGPPAWELLCIVLLVMPLARLRSCRKHL